MTEEKTSLSLPQLGNLGAMFAGLPSIDQLPVEKTWCARCEAIAPRITVFGYSAVICPECRAVHVDAPGK